jgi:hypothetical protein
MIQAGLYEKIPAAVWDIDWNVNCQAVGTAEATLNYLAPYIGSSRPIFFQATETQREMHILPKLCSH